MKHWLLSMAAIAGLGLAGAGCGEKAAKITWKEATGTVINSTMKEDGSSITEIEYDIGKGKTVTTHMGSKLVPKGQSVKLKFDEANPGSIQSIEGL